ncbi:hypothetical protein P43SY_005965 [Pythium insidiosum]|uniref:Protein phosphatase 2C n=1 Tax=Pythium insidiosum TaxID=114742 RepID=A0AAD5Q961_PYTIN|nr:hypothetical protein P43SY_005965 [Pythium insidiosum]
MAEQMPPTLEVLRKYDDIEHRRRSLTINEPYISSFDSRKGGLFGSARLPGVNRLLRPNADDPELWTNRWTQLVLKMTSFSDDDAVTSFRFGADGGGIGREPTNAAAIPADKLMERVDHARIMFRHGCFYVVNGAANNSGTYVRLPPCEMASEPRDDSVREEMMAWPLQEDTVFRAGKSDFRVVKFDEATQTTELIALSGRLVGTTFTVGPEGGGIGRSADNLIHMGDGELSRKHCRIWFDELSNRFYLIDLGSTNGTFMKLVGPYQDPYRLETNDDLLIAQTCMTVNRFDYGAHANMGARKQMEDHHTILQDLDISCLNQQRLQPQSFVGVFDGHGGMEASSFVCERLHHNIMRELRSRRRDLDPDIDVPRDDVYRVIEESLVMAFERTDEEFLTSSERPQAGSTATTVFFAGNQMFVANVGDSRTVLSRKGLAVRLSNDHKPSRPDEAQRIRDTGGFVIHGRIMGELAVSRAFGDSPFKTFDLPEPPKTGSDANGSKPRSEYDSQELPVNPNEILKGPLVIATPEITRTEVTGDEEFILLASDGLFDVLKDQEAIAYVRQKIIELGDVQRAVEATVEHAIVQQRSMDNVTAVVVLFKTPKELAETLVATPEERPVASGAGDK